MARSKQGIRTKPLKDAGYKTLADVYTASLYDLESVHGIGESMASSAKRFTQQYAAEAKKGLRLRLSTDRKTPEATAVVGLVYARLRAEPLVDKCEHLAPNVLSEMDAASHGLLLARNPEKWLFASKTGLPPFPVPAQVLVEPMLRLLGQRGAYSPESCGVARNCSTVSIAS